MDTADQDVHDPNIISLACDKNLENQNAEKIDSGCSILTDSEGETEDLSKLIEPDFEPVFDQENMDENTPLLAETPIVVRTLSVLANSRTGKVSADRTLMNLLSGMIGDGCLALPVAFKQAGLWMGFSLCFVIGFLNLHCMNMLVRSAQYLMVRSGKRELDYGHLAKKALDYGPVRWRRHSKTALHITNSVVAIYQIGVCAVMAVFIAAHIKQIFESIIFEQLHQSIDISVRIYLCIILIPMILITFIRDLRVVAVLSTLGNFLMLIVFILIFQQLVQPPNEIRNLPAITDFGSIILGLGSILYAFEGQAMILPLENKMERPREMLGTFGVLNTGMYVVLCMYAATGFFGYISFGEAVKGSILLNFPFNVLYNTVRGLLVVNCYIGLPLQWYVVTEMFWGAIKRKFLYGCPRFHLPFELGFRTVLVLLTFILGIAIPQLEDIIPLVGVTAGMLLAFVFPPFIECVTFWDVWMAENNQRQFVIYLVKNGALIILGFFGLIAGLYANIVQLSSN